MRTNRLKYLLGILTIGTGVSAPASAASQEAKPLYENIRSIDQKFIISTENLIAPEMLEGIVHGINFDTDSILHVDVTGRASIDGPEERNDRLAKSRAEKISQALQTNYNIPADKISIHYIGEDWDLFRKLVEEDPNVPSKGYLLTIIDSNVSPAEKERMIKGADNGALWRYLSRNILPEMRVASVEWRVMQPEPFQPVYIYEEVKPEEEEVPVQETEIIVLDEVVREEEPEPIADDWYRKMYIKTNAPAWALLWQNLAVEVDLAKHWSFSLPVYWSPYNYGKQTLKFRTLAFVPEFRYWPKAENMGFFVNAHFGLGYYNYAKNGDYRYQDHRGKTPAIGGGVGVGYRFYFCKNHHWSIEVALGAGIYKLDYDIFLNTPQTKNGYLIGREKRTFYGIDQAAVTFSYSFGLRKKGGRK